MLSSLRTSYYNIVGLPSFLSQRNSFYSSTTEVVDDLRERWKRTMLTDSSATVSSDGNRNDRPQNESRTRSTDRRKQECNQKWT
mmetsp:Transcript_144/g.272  ORF Transcript_144/g.272 Transcript_144/m.272 type:complete len:84 (-) Transcript_144:246-497(-)